MKSKRTCLDDLLSCLGLGKYPMSTATTLVACRKLICHAGISFSCDMRDTMTTDNFRTGDLDAPHESGSDDWYSARGPAAEFSDHEVAGRPGCGLYAGLKSL